LQIIHLSNGFRLDLSTGKRTDPTRLACPLLEVATNCEFVRCGHIEKRLHYLGSTLNVKTGSIKKYVSAMAETIPRRCICKYRADEPKEGSNTINFGLLTHRQVTLHDDNASPRSPPYSKFAFVPVPARGHLAKSAQSKYDSRTKPIG
jgi:hypothetical protein